MIKHLNRNQIFIVFTIIGLITVFLTLVVYLSTKEEEKTQYTIPEINPEQNLASSDFLLEKPDLMDIGLEYYLLRKQFKKWEWVQAEKYWVNIKRIIIDILTLENDEKMEDLIERIP